MGRGVVINDQTRHAKVIVKGRRAAIGSANLSGRTLPLNEAVWVTQDDAVLESAERWVNEMLDERAEMTESELQGLTGLFPKGRDGNEPAGPEVTIDPFDPDRVESIIFWAADGDKSGGLPGDREASEIEPGLDGYRWIHNEDWADARKGQVWMRYERKLESPRRVIQPCSTQEAPDGSRWTRVGFLRADRGMRSMPAWLRDEYGDAIRARILRGQEPGSDPGVAVALVKRAGVIDSATLSVLSSSLCTRSMLGASMVASGIARPRRMRRARPAPRGGRD